VRREFRAVIDRAVERLRAEDTDCPRLQQGAYPPHLAISPQVTEARLPHKQEAGGPDQR
jgi:hypothetical protein